MVLNLADSGSSWKSLQTLWNVLNPSKTIYNSFRNCLCRFRVNSKGSKIGRFWAKSLGYSPWFWTWRILVTLRNRSKLLETISNSFRDCLCRFRVNSQGSKIGQFWARSLGYSPWFWTWRILVTPGNPPNSLKRLLNPSKTIDNSFRNCLCRFRVNSKGSKIGRFWAKSLGYSPWFWTWRILVTLRNRSKLLETISNSFRDCLCRFRVNSQGSKIGQFWARSLGYSPWFWTWRILVTPGNPPNSLKRLLNPSKTIHNSFRGCLCRFRVNSPGSKIGRFWAKSLGKSPWFWTWRILLSPGNHSKISETSRKPS